MGGLYPPADLESCYPHEGSLQLSAHVGVVVWIHAFPNIFVDTGWPFPGDDCAVLIVFGIDRDRQKNRVEMTTLALAELDTRQLNAELHSRLRV